MRASLFIMETKFCLRCKKQLSTESFNKKTGAIDGLAHWCKDCRSEYRKSKRIKKIKNIPTITFFDSEKWEDVPEYEGLYKISNFGRVLSLARIAQRVHCGRVILIDVHEKIRIPSYSKNFGYYMVCFCKNGDHKMIKVHKLVATLFVPNPDNKPQINHIDGDKLNNRADNLEWCTQHENQTHAFKIGLNNNDHLIKLGESHPQSKLTDIKVLEIREIGKSMSQQKIADKYGVTQSTIGYILRREIWAHI